MSKYYIDSKGRKFVVIRKKIPCTTLYLYSGLYDDLMDIMYSLVDKKTQKMMQDLSLAIHNQIPHLECDNIIDSYIVEEGYNYK